MNRGTSTGMAPWPSLGWAGAAIALLKKSALALLGAVMLLAAWGSAASAAVCGTTTWTLWAGQTINVGTLTVANDADNLYVTYTLTYPGASFGTLHLWVGTDLSNVPANNAGNPVPGQFPFQITPPVGTTTYTFAIPLTDLQIQDITKACPLKLYVVAHAEVKNVGGNDETAFGGDKPGPFGNRWWYYAEYNLCCTIPPPQLRSCRTGFAKGGYVFVTDPKANPEHLPSVNLSKQRWGWAIKLVAPSNSVYDIWAGAGLNYTSKGTKVGRLNVAWDGSVVDVTYTMFSGYVMKELHIYAGDAAPTTSAPGQYGYTQYFDPPITTHSAQFSLQDLNGVPGVWLIAHAVVCSVN